MATMDFNNVAPGTPFIYTYKGFDPVLVKFLGVKKLGAKVHYEFETLDRSMRFGSPIPIGTRYAPTAGDIATGAALLAQVGGAAATPTARTWQDAIEKQFKGAVAHDGHEVVVPPAILGKTYKYCRTCKVEVN